jgi:rare lipoprotein A
MHAPRSLSEPVALHRGSRAALLSIVLAGCGGLGVKDSAPVRVVDFDAIPDAVPQVEPQSKYGNGPVYRVNGDSYRVLARADGYRERGVASWYGTKFHGQRTSSGETYDMYTMTAAHKTLPLPTYARVTNLQNGRSVVVRINDRGPFHDDRLIDLSYVAALKLDVVASGTGLVEVSAIDPRATQPAVERRPVVPPETPPQLYVQLGAFAQPDNAQRVADQLSDHGFTPRIMPAQLGSDLLHRVRIGPLPSVEQADELMRRLLRLGYAQRRVVVD